MSSIKRPTVDVFGKAVARHLNARRAHQGLTQQNLAKLTEISQSQLSKQLRGMRALNLDEFEAICEALAIPMKAIIDLAEQELSVGKNVVNIRTPIPLRSNELPTSVQSSTYDDDDIIAGINAGTERFAAQEATDPLDEEYT